MRQVIDIAERVHVIERRSFPDEVDMPAVRFDPDAERNLSLVDDSGFELGVSEFSSRE